ncbi:MAG: kelch repeat-containing protein [Thermosphaera sp.]
MNETSELSEREIEILKLVATGLSNKEIAYQLSISPNTVKVHLKNIFSKIGVVSRTEAAMFAVRQGWVEAGHQAAVEAAEEKEQHNVTGLVQTSFSPLLLSFLGVGGFALMIVLVIFLVNLSSRNNPQVIEIVVTPTPEPVRWELVTQMPEPKKSMAYAAVDNKIYIIGGETPNGISDRVDIYDTVTGQWSEGARKPTPASEACGAYLGGKIIVAGGKKADGTVTNVVEAYDVAEDRWEKLPELPNPLAGAGCVEYEGSYYLIGGWDGEQVRGEVWRYKEKWKSYGNIQQPRAYHSVVKVSGYIYIIGGWDSKQGLRDVGILNITKEISDNNYLLFLPEPRYNLASQGILSNIYLIGGQNDSGNVAYSLEINPQTGQKRLFSNLGGGSWYALGAVWLGEYIYAFGGSGVHHEILDDISRSKILYNVTIPIIIQK